MVLYKKIAKHLSELISSGRYKPGEKLPSIREVTGQFNCSKLTVQKAYEVLKNEGKIENIVGSGSFVRYPQKITGNDNVFDFSSDYISESFFPYQTAKEIMNRLFDDERSGVFKSPPVEGDPELIRALGEFYHAPPKRILIVSGAQQGLDLASKVFSTRISDSILFEDPTYSGAISLFKARHFVPMTHDGPDIDEMDKKMSTLIKLFYTMPTVHNPTGATYGLKKRTQVGERARKHGFYIIEDDYMSEYHPSPPPRFLDMFPDRTIYIKSISQTTASAIRLGFMVVPEDLYDQFVYAKYMSDIGSAGLIQKFIREFIKRGDFSEYIEITKRKIEERKDKILKMIDDNPYIETEKLRHGTSLWVRVKNKAPFYDISLPDGSEFSFSPEYKNHFRLSFMNMDDDTFEKALGYLGNGFSRLSSQ